MPDYRRNRIPGGTFFFTVNLLERGIWQRRFWEHTIRDERDYAADVDYVHINPLKHGLVACARDWPHSSFHRCVLQGIYAPDWAGQDVNDLPTGERGG